MSVEDHPLPDEATIIKREALKTELAETNRQINALKLTLQGNCNIKLIHDLKALKRRQWQLQTELGQSRRIMDRGEMPYSTAFLAVAGRLLPASVFKELRLATRDFRKLERDVDVEEMLLERREYVEEAIRGVKY